MSKKMKVTKKTEENKSSLKTGYVGRPSNAMKELIDKYQIDKDEEWVDNTIDTIFEDKADEIESLFDSIKKYGDVSVYKILPKKVDKYLRTYGQAVKEYYGKNVSFLSNREVVIHPEEYIKCRHCGMYKNPSKFSRMSDESIEYLQESLICVDCANELFATEYNITKNLLESYLYVCYKCDLLCLHEVIDMIEEKMRGDANYIPTFSDYLILFPPHRERMKIAKDECTFEYTNFKGIPFKNKVLTAVVDPIYNETLVEHIEDEEIVEEDEVVKLEKNKRKIKELRNKFGNYETKDLIQLEYYWNRWYETSVIPDGYEGETMVSQLCYMQLQIEEAKAENKSISKLSGDFRKFIRECGITGKKSKKVDEEMSLDQLIELCENQGPIPEPDEDFADVDGIKKLVNAISGGIARTLRKPNELTEAFEKDYAEHTVDFDAINKERESDGEN